MESMFDVFLVLACTLLDWTGENGTRQYGMEMVYL